MHGKWRLVAKFFEGMTISIAARFAGWIAIVSITVFWQFVGHVVGDVVLHVVSAILSR